MNEVKKHENGTMIVEVYLKEEGEPIVAELVMHYDVMVWPEELVSKLMHEFGAKLRDELYYSINGERVQ